MKKIRIISAPKSIVSVEIQKQWIGLEIPIIKKSKDGYEIQPKDALKALEDAKREEALIFWKNIFQFVEIFVFKEEVCELIE